MLPWVNVALSSSIDEHTRASVAYNIFLGIVGLPQGHPVKLAFGEDSLTTIIDAGDDSIAIRVGQRQT